MNDLTKLTVKALYSLEHTKAAVLLESVSYPWEALEKIGETIKEIGSRLPK